MRLESGQVEERKPKKGKKPMRQGLAASASNHGHPPPGKLPPRPRPHIDVSQGLPSR